MLSAAIPKSEGAVGHTSRELERLGPEPARKISGCPESRNMRRVNVIKTRCLTSEQRLDERKPPLQVSNVGLPHAEIARPAMARADAETVRPGAAAPATRSPKPKPPDDRDQVRNAQATRARAVAWAPSWRPPTGPSRCRRIAIADHVVAEPSAAQPSAARARIVRPEEETDLHVHRSTGGASAARVRPGARRAQGNDIRSGRCG